MNKLQRSWSLFKSSLSIIARNKKLLAFPIVISVCTMAIILFFLAPPVLRPTSHPYTSAEHWQTIYHSLFTQTHVAGQPDNQVALTPAAGAYLVFIYFVSMFLPPSSTSPSTTKSSPRSAASRSPSDAD